MAKNTQTTPQVDATDKNANLDNGQVDVKNTQTTPQVDATKLLIGKMKGIGLDSKGLYTEWNNGALDSDGNNSAVDMIDFMIMKHKLSADDKAAILTMFGAMAKANAPKVKQVKTIPEGLAEDLGQAWIVRHQTLAEYNAAKKAIDMFWCAALDASKTELDAVCKTVTDAGFTPDRKTGAIKTAKSGSTTNGEHGNAGTVKLQYGTTITVGNVSYNGWKDLAKNLVTSVYAGDTPTNYIQNTAILDKLVELGLPVEVFVKPTVKGATKEKALEAWATSKAKTALDAHPSIKVNVS